MAGQSFFYPVHLTLFAIISVETRNTSGGFIQSLARFFDLVTGNNLNTEMASGKTNFFDGKCCKQQHKRRQAERKLLVQLRAENYALLGSGESRKSVAQLAREVVCRSCDVYVDQRSFGTCSSNATATKIWNLGNFCQFFPRQKLEVNKIGSSTTYRNFS